MHLKTSKSPGLDGLTPEFYKYFWPTLKQPFFNMINDTFLLGYCPIPLKQQSLHRCIKKIKKDDLKNYRPKSLTNYDYKIIAFVLTARLQKVIDGIISKSQTACIKSRFIGSNMKVICDLIDYCEKFQASGILLSLDFEKAFDIYY